MKSQSILAVLILAGFILGSSAVSIACDAAGPNKHIGPITTVDAQGGTFTIRDAQTDDLMTFEATHETLKDLKMENRVLVSYKEEDGRLIAVEVHS